MEIAGAFHFINCSYKAGILFEQIMHDKALSDIEKITESLLLFYGRVDGPMAEKAEKIIWFYSCGKGTEEATTCSAADEKAAEAYLFIFEYDAEYIYAAFGASMVLICKRKTCTGGSFWRCFVHYPKRMKSAGL